MPAPASIWQGFTYDGTYIIDVDAPVALLDTPIKIRVTGLKAKQPMTLRASITDKTNQAWESFATFIADDKGVVDVSSTAPLYGTYLKPDGMGLFWSMLPVGWGNPESRSFETPDPMIVTITAEAMDKSLTSVQVTRLRGLDGKVTRQSIRTDGIVGTLFYPNAPGKYPAVITLTGGLSEVFPRLLASRGYTVFSLAYFGVESLPKELVEIPLEYFAKAIRWLKTQPSVNPERIVVMGGANGGELALLLGATWPQDIKAVIGYAPSAVVTEGISSGREIKSSWTLGGAPLPFIKYYPPAPECAIFTSKYPFVFGCAFDKALDDQAAVAAASIAVEKSSGPVLLISGTDDQVWPSTRLADMVVARLKASNFPFAYVHLRYEGAGHFSIPYFPANQTQSIGIVYGGSAEANAAASADSYPKMLDFLSKYFK
jgi:dienelactone hydrolase